MRTGSSDSCVARFSTPLTSLAQPVAAGSGVPEVIAFLNGVKIPRIARIKTLFVKLFATILGVPAGLAIGPEGPIVQIGGMVGASLAQGKSTSLGVETGYNKVGLVAGRAAFLRGGCVFTVAGHSIGPLTPT